MWGPLTGQAGKDLAATWCLQGSGKVPKEEQELWKTWSVQCSNEWSAEHTWKPGSWTWTSSSPCREQDVNQSIPLTPVCLGSYKCHQHCSRNMQAEYMLSLCWHGDVKHHEQNKNLCALRVLTGAPWRLWLSWPFWYKLCVLTPGVVFYSRISTSTFIKKTVWGPAGYR